MRFNLEQLFQSFKELEERVNAVVELHQGLEKSSNTRIKELLLDELLVTKVKASETKEQITVEIEKLILELTEMKASLECDKKEQPKESSQCDKKEQPKKSSQCDKKEQPKKSSQCVKKEQPKKSSQCVKKEQSKEGSQCVKKDQPKESSQCVKKETESKERVVPSDNDTSKNDWTNVTYKKDRKVSKPKVSSKEPEENVIFQSGKVEILGPVQFKLMTELAVDRLKRPYSSWLDLPPDFNDYKTMAQYLAARTVPVLREELYGRHLPYVEKYGEKYNKMKPEMIELALDALYYHREMSVEE